MLNVAELKQCSQCGCCESVCKNVKVIARSGRSYQDHLPHVKNRDLCKKCKNKQCLSVCPLFGKQTDNWLGPIKEDRVDLGKIKSIIIGATQIDEIAKKAASGGVVTSIVKYLLDEKRADKAYVVVKDANNAGSGHYIKADNFNSLLNSCSSIYTPVPFGNILESILDKNNHEKVVIVGRPCQIRAVENTEKIYPWIKEKVILKISIFCAWLISKKGLGFLSKIAGVDNQDKLKDVDYRLGAWPGVLRFTTDDGEKVFPFYNKKNTYGTYYYPLATPFIPDVCRKCYDVLGLRADISVGDPWNLGLVSGKRHGYSIYITRTQRALELIGEKKLKDRYVHHDFVISEEQLAQSQANTIQIKQTGVFNNSFGCHSNKRDAKNYSIINRFYSLLVQYCPNWLIPQFLYKFYSAAIWKKLKRRLNPTLFIENT